jgi:hypothetical protein
MSDLGKKFHAQKWEHIFMVGKEMVMRKPDMLVDHGARIALNLLLEKAEKQKRIDGLGFDRTSLEELRAIVKEILGS